MEYKAITSRNFEEMEFINKLSPKMIDDIKIVSRVLPFRTNNYVIDKLINWDNIPDDPIYQLTFPQKGMLSDLHYNRIKNAVDSGIKGKELRNIIKQILLELNPHPAGQQEYNVPMLDNEPLHGVQHKYRETILFFPAHGQSCFAYCTFCFRWAQFAGIGMKFANSNIQQLIEYLHEHPNIQDVLFTGGDPMIMKPNIFEKYIDPLLEADIPNLRTIRIGSKVLSYWPYKFINNTSEGDHYLSIFEKITDSGKHLAFMAHFNHYNELSTPEVKEAISNLRKTGAQIRTQSPILNHINNDPDIWAKMWIEQTSLGMIPYYMFIPRDTGAQEYFKVTLERAWNVFTGAYQKISGISRTVRGPVMSTTLGKIHIQGITNINGEKLFSLSFIQGRNPEWVNKPFYAKYDPDAIWFDQLKPYGKYFFSDEINRYMKSRDRIELEIVDISNTETEIPAIGE